MGIGETDIFGQLERLRRDLNRFAASIRSTDQLPDQDDNWTPPVDITERDDALYLVVDLPGLERDDIDLHVDAEAVTLQGERTRAETGNHIRLERPAGRFRRSFRIGVPIDPSGVQATYRDGVLQIKIPMKAPSGPTRVRVDVE
jgi:HSP20 family protein